MKYIFLFCIIILNACSAQDSMMEDNIELNGNSIQIKYINFKPKQVNKTCLGTKIDKILTIIANEKKAREIFTRIPSGEYFSKKYDNERKEIKRLGEELIQQKHISTKGNHEWQKLVSRKHIVIEDEKRHIYIMYPLEPMMFIMSGIAFEKINKGEVILVRGLKNWVDVKGCMQL